MLDCNFKPKAEWNVVNFLRLPKIAISDFLDVCFITRETPACVGVAVASYRFGKLAHGAIDSQFRGRIGFLRSWISLFSHLEDLRFKVIADLPCGLQPKVQAERPDRYLSFFGASLAPDRADSKGVNVAIDLA